MNTPVYICIPTTVERTERLAECIKSIHENAGYPHVIATYENYREGFIGPIQTILSGLKPETLVWCIGDDTRLIEPNTLRRLVERWQETEDGVVQPDDGIQNGNIITMPLCSAYTMAKYTFKGYFLNYADNEFTILMTLAKKYLYCPEIKVEHQHWVNGKAKKDETYEFANTKCADDQALFMHRKANNFMPLNEL